MPGVTRLMKLSATSTSTSRLSMSTMVQMPVRVKPPPATGATISPGWAAVAVTTPANGARTTVSSSLRRNTSTVAWADARLALGKGEVLARRVKDAGRSSSTISSLSQPAGTPRCCDRTSTRSRQRRPAATRMPAWADAACAIAWASAALALESSIVAITWPASTCWPSSIITSATLPATLAETVASRRATT